MLNDLSLCSLMKTENSNTWLKKSVKTWRMFWDVLSQEKIKSILARVPIFSQSIHFKWLRCIKNQVFKWVYLWLSIIFHILKIGTWQKKVNSIILSFCIKLCSRLLPKIETNSQTTSQMWSTGSGATLTWE